MFVSYTFACRNCLKTDGIRHMYGITGVNDSNVYFKKTEYEIMLMIEKWREQDNKACEFCGSNNVEVREVEIDSESLYNYDRLVKRCQHDAESMFMINIDKRDSEISLREGGSSSIPYDFLKESINTIEEIINTRPYDFVPQIKGNFLICLTGGFDFINNKTVIRIERYRSIGLTREEILNQIENFKKIGL
jgi:hypothetical protein